MFVRREYTYKKRHLRILAHVVDTVGYFIHTPHYRVDSNPRRVLVVRLDQLGDVVQTLPLLDGLRTSFPAAVVDVLTTPVGADLLAYRSFSGKVLTWNCPWFDATRRPDKTRAQ